ncbi:response regulator transcription factor [Domibacillus robiginosus]|uniref:response regulator transcription factor n=1 Tax=Domibacillus robiginosus TaxID=1071054 RepID=UPI00067DA6A3|nr:response regulator transcription factor [Domibacillus robiginosus]
MYSILISGIEEPTVNSLDSFLVRENIRCLQAASENEVIHMIQNEVIDLLVLDPTSLSNYWLETCKKVKSISPIPILILPESDDRKSILDGLHAGVDDFMNKPIDEEILLAKIKANLRREGFKNVNEIHFKGLVLNREMYEVSYEGVLLLLTQKEFHLLEHFLSHRNQVITRETLISQIWGYRYTDARTAVQETGCLSL